MLVVTVVFVSVVAFLQNIFWNIKLISITSVILPLKEAALQTTEWQQLKLKKPQEFSLILLYKQANIVLFSTAD